MTKIRTVTIVGFQWFETELPAKFKNRAFRISSKKKAIDQAGQSK